MNIVSKMIFLNQWPLDNGLIKLSPVVTGDEDKMEWGNMIKKFFINSRGLSITMEDDTHLFVSLNVATSSPAFVSRPLLTTTITGTTFVTSL